MKKNESPSLPISEYITLLEETKNLSRTKSQNNILPKISDYMNSSNTKKIKSMSTTTINSINNSVTINKTISKNMSHINLFKNQVNHREFFPLSTKIKLYQEPKSKKNLFSNNLFITEDINQKKKTNKKEENNLEKDLTNLEKLKYIKFIPIDKKNKKINIGKKIPIIDYIKKTKQYKLMKYSLIMKKERVNRIIENKTNEISSLNETIKSLQFAKEKYNNEYSVKYYYYLKNLLKQIEDEKEINQKLMLKINEIKKEMIIIEQKIQKIQIEKEKISRWFYFQIQVKEKLISLPFNYKNILENNINENKQKIIKIENLTDNDIIKKYKNKIIFENAEDFFGEFDKIAELTLQYMKKYQIIKERVEKIKKERNDILNEDLTKEKKENNKMKITVEKLNILKSIYIQNMNKKKELEKKEIFNYFSENKIQLNKKKRDITLTTKGSLFHSLSTDYLWGKNKEINYNSILYKKVYNIFQISLNFGINYKYLIQQHESLTTKINDSIENKMLIMLEFIESVLNILIEKYNYYKNNKIYAIEFKKVTTMIDKINKHKNYLKQVQIMEEKSFEVIRNIQKRMNKKYVLPYRKVDCKYFTNKKFNYLNLSPKTKEHSLTFYDFMHE